MKGSSRDHGSSRVVRNIESRGKQRTHFLDRLFSPGGKPRRDLGNQFLNEGAPVRLGHRGVGGARRQTEIRVDFRDYRGKLFMRPSRPLQEMRDISMVFGIEDEYRNST